jgi:hypothetical protein
MTLPLLKPLQRELKLLVSDLHNQSEERHYEAAFGTRTGDTYDVWRDEQVEQAAVAWLLGTVYVRFCEDNDLIDQPWIAGPGDRTDAAAQAQTAYLVEQTELRHGRHWLREAFTHLGGLAVTAALFDQHNPVWHWDISADVADGLLDFWRRGAGVHDFADPDLDTRFLGDLYQNLSVVARKRYALLQTPPFVVDFILNLTLESSLKEYGLEDTSLIDPTCGSGNFLLCAFGRLLKRWEWEQPAMDSRERAQKVLNQVTGVDINPFAVAIARFRLLVAALHACEEKRLADAPGFRMRLATGDSLLKWGEDSSHQGDLHTLSETGNAYAYYTEDANALAEYLRPGQYTVAVGNPPYITVKDKFLNAKYRELYKKTCSGQYALSAPFVQRFFQLVRRADQVNRTGIVGQITANSFMKREFGKRVVETYFAREIELSYVIDTSGAYIPGHATPTVILVGRMRPPGRERVRAILGVRGEPSTPERPSEGKVWRAIVDSVLNCAHANPFVTAVDLPRDTLAKHPWSLAGGGAIELLDSIAGSNTTTLRSRVSLAGFMALTREDDAYFIDTPTAKRRSFLAEVRPLGDGVGVRDWATTSDTVSIFPYSENGDVPKASLAVLRFLWPNRRLLQLRRALSGSHEERGVPWFTYSDFHPDRWASALLIAFAFVATHNHFVLARGGKVYKQTAPVIMLPVCAREEDHIELLGLLNSSTLCFWLKQVCSNKGVGGIGGGIGDEAWEPRYELSSTQVMNAPMPDGAPTERASRLDRLAQERGALQPVKVCAGEVPSRERLDAARTTYDRIRGEMISVQEELDWEVYRLYGLLDEELTATEDALPALKLGERAFEIVLARRVAAGEASTEWFARHGSTPVTDVPQHWPHVYRDLVARRIEVIESRPDIALIERPECKRRWAATPWENQEKAALQDWLRDRLEAQELWRGPGANQPMSVAVLADVVGADPDFRSVLTLHCGRDDYDVTTELTRLVADEVVPYLAAYRYKPSGLDKRAQWERTWDLQRREDAGETLDKPIPVPPKYAHADFVKVSYWRNRGKLDVPKERFIGYPHAGRDSDRSPLIGWAGWDHLEQAQALAAVYIDRKQVGGWPKERLLPLLAGLVELEPWLHQWHHEPAPGYPGSPAAFYTTFIDAELAAHGADRADVELGRLPS